MTKDTNNHLLDRIKLIYTERGFKQFFITILNYIPEQFIYIEYVYKLDLNRINYIPPYKGLEFKVMSVNDLEYIFNNYREELGKKIYQNLLEKLKNPQYNGFIIRKDNEICGYFFLSYKNTEPNLDIEYVNTKYNGYLSRDHVFKKYRGNKIHQYAIYKRLEILKQKNYRTATVLIHKNNYPSITSYKKFGFKNIGIVYYFHFRKWMKSKINYKSKK